MTFSPYKRVVLLGVDGAGTFFRQADTPQMDRIFRDGAVTHQVLTSIPTISAQCWGSMLLGVAPDVHRLTNSIVSAVPYDPASPFPSVFRQIRAADPTAPLASFCNWNPINHGIIESDLGVHKETARDAELTDRICTYLRENDPVFLFVQFDEVDGAGHGHGYGTKEHLDQITVTDGYIGRIYDVLRETERLEDTLFLVTADHGGKDHSHGGTSEEEKIVTFCASGKTVIPGTVGEMEIRDCASIVLYALGLSQPQSWTGRVPSGLFAGVDAMERPVYVIPYEKSYRVRQNPPAAPGTDALRALPFASRIRTYLPLDGSVEDAWSPAENTPHGKLYFVDGYFGRGIRLDDGYISLPSCPAGKESFSISLWLKTGGVPGDPAILSNKDWKSGRNPGFVLSLSSGSVIFNAGDGQHRMDLHVPLPPDYHDGWMHIALSVDRTMEEVRMAVDFGPFVTAPIPEELKGASFGEIRWNLGQDGTGAYACGLSAVLDDVLIADGVLTEEDLASLAQLYGAAEQK